MLDSQDIDTELYAPFYFLHDSSETEEDNFELGNAEIDEVVDSSVTTPEPELSTSYFARYVQKKNKILKKKEKCDTKFEHKNIVLGERLPESYCAEKMGENINVIKRRKKRENLGISSERYVEENAGGYLLSNEEASSSLELSNTEKTPLLGLTELPETYNEGEINLLQFCK